MQQTILITGSNGLLGQKLVELIVSEKQYKLVATARGSNRLPKQTNYIFETLDITNELEVMSIITKHKPSYVIDRKSTRLNSSHSTLSRMPSSA